MPLVVLALRYHGAAMDRVINGILALALVSIVLGWGGYVEGRLFPVVTRAKITEIAAGTDYRDGAVVPSVDIWIRTEKLRDCEFGKISLRTAQGRTIEYLPPPVRGGSRAPGDFTVGPFHLLRATPKDIEGIRMTVTHDCPGLPWLTITDFSPE